MTGRMLAEIEIALLAEKPDCMLVYGDTNSTLAGALAAAKLHVPVAHVEAGLRSFDRQMPEEINRVVTDHVSTLLFCPTASAVENLRSEGIASGAKKIHVLKVGDVMEDSTRLFINAARQPAFALPQKPFVLATIHRAENTDNPLRLKQLVVGLNALHEKYGVVMPIHPRTLAAIKREGLSLGAQLLPPVGYLEILWLLQRCGLVVTDSGGLQKEAFFIGRQCVTCRDTTEWVELLQEGSNVLVGTDSDKLLYEAACRFGIPSKPNALLYGGGQASQRIAQNLELCA